MARDPTIPTLTPNVAPSGRITAFVPRVDVSPMNQYFADMQGRANKALDLALAITQKQQEIEAKAAFNKFDVELNKHLDDSYYSKKNQERINSYAPTAQALYGIAKKYSDNLTGTARDSFNAAANERMKQATISMQTNYMKTLRQWEETENQAHLGNLMSDALKELDDWQNPNGAFAVSVQAARDQTAEILYNNGIPTHSEAFKAGYLKTMSSFHGGALDSFLEDEDIRQSRAYYNKFKEEMTVEDQMKYERRMARLQEILNSRYQAEIARQQAEQARLNNISLEDQWQITLRHYRGLMDKVRNDPTLSQEEKGTKLAGLQSELAVQREAFTKYKQQSALNDTQVKNGYLDAAKAKVTAAIAQKRKELGRAVRPGDLTIEDVFTNNELANLQEYDLLDQIRELVNNAGVVFPKESDYEFYEEATSHPERYIYKSSEEMFPLISRLPDDMQRKVQNAIENASQGNFNSRSTQMINEALDSLNITDKALRGKFRDMAERRAMQIGSIDPDKVVTAKELEENLALAIIELQSIGTQGWFGNSINTNVSGYLRNEVEGGNQDFFFGGVYRDPQGIVTNIRIPVEWLNSPAGVEAQRKAFAQARAMGMQPSSNFILGQLAKIYNDQMEEQERLDAERNTLNMGLRNE